MGQSRLSQKMRPARIELFSTGVGLLLLLASEKALAGPFTLSFGSRLVSNSGDFVQGPIDVEIRFFRVSTGGSQVGTTILRSGVPLLNGSFQIDLTDLTPANVAQTFAAELPTWVEVTDTSNGTVYPRQQLTAVPYALRVPVDGESVVVNAQGQVAIGTIDISQKTVGGDVSGTVGAMTVNSIKGVPFGVVTGAGDAGKFLSYDGSKFVLSVGGGGGSQGLIPMSPLVVNASNQLSIGFASAISSGILSPELFIAFNSKQQALGFSPLNSAGGTMTGNLNMGGGKQGNKSCSTHGSYRCYD